MSNGTSASDQWRLDSKRLANQAFVAGASEDAAMAALGLADGHLALDVGCGNGIVAERLKKRFARLTVDGIERNATLAAEARETGRINAVHVLDAVEDPWPTGPAYDVAYARFVLRHVSRPLRLVQRMCAAAKPGGRVSLVESDDATFFTSPPLDVLHEAFAACREAGLRRSPESNPLAGFYLADYAREAGLTELRTRIATFSSHEFKSPDDAAGTKYVGAATLSFLWTPQATGYTPERCEEVRRAYEAWSSLPEAYFRWSVLFLGGTKP